MELSDFGREYLLLGLRMGKIIDKYVDAYFGPKELKFIVENEAQKSPTELLEICEILQKKLRDQGYQPERVTYFEKMLTAMKTSLEIKTGREIPYLEQIERLFDIKPIFLEDSILYDAIEKLDSIFEGPETLYERVKNVFERRRLPKDKIIETLNHGNKIVRGRTYALFPDLLPIGEEVMIEKTHDQSWGAYNWYLGLYKSRIEFNVDSRLSWRHILMFMAHEGYPGHHTESCVKDKTLYQEQKRFECSILLIHSPPMVIYEGIGELSIDVLFTPREQIEIVLENYCPNSLDEDLEQLITEGQAWNQLSGYLTNIAFHKHVEGWSDNELITYLKDLGFLPIEQINERIRFITDPLWSTYSLNYYVGGMLIKNRYGRRPSPKNFETLLRNSILPSDLV